MVVWSAIFKCILCGPISIIIPNLPQEMSRTLQCRHEKTENKMLFIVIVWRVLAGGREGCIYTLSGSCPHQPQSWTVGNLTAPLVKLGVKDDQCRISTDLTIYLLLKLCIRCDCELLYMSRFTFISLLSVAFIVSLSSLFHSNVCVASEKIHTLRHRHMYNYVITF